MRGTREAYNAYISNSPEWAAKRKQKLQQVGYRCQGCGSDERLEVHHLTYERFGHERLEDLQVLCHLCHMREHGMPPDAGPIAGPTAADFAQRVLDPGTIRKQGTLAMFVGAAEQIEVGLALLEANELPRQARKRIALIRRELRKLLDEIAGP